jgi:hypothetical protein
MWSARFQFLKPLTQELKFGNLKESVGLEKIGVNHNVDHGINNAKNTRFNLFRNSRLSLAKAFWLKSKF